MGRNTKQETVHNWLECIHKSVRRKDSVNNNTLRNVLLVDRDTSVYLNVSKNLSSMNTTTFMGTFIHSSVQNCFDIN